MSKKKQILLSLLAACLIGFLINMIDFLYGPKEKLKVNLHEVKYIEHEYKTVE